MSVKLSRRTVVGSLACVGLGPSALRAQQSDQGFLELLRERRAAHNLPGLAAALIRGGRIAAVGVDGVRQLDAAEAIELGDRFHIASCTKSMTATLAADAVRRGRLAWSTSLAHVLPELGRAVRPEYRGATLERLLAHGAHMPSYTQPSSERVAWMHGLRGTPTEQRLAFLRDVLTTEAPNDATGNGAYSNTGYVAACAMLERATRSAWEGLIHRNLAAPLGLRSLGFGYPATASSPNQPRGHAAVEGRIELLPFDPMRNLPVCLRPAGAVHVSIGDLARYAADHLNGLSGRPALLPPDYYSRLHSPLSGSGSVFTLGWGVRHDERLGRLHFGAGSGGWFFALIWIAPQRDAAMVAVSNSGEAAMATRELAERLLGS